jgi:drug/metabolite transporter (DMT)-like permease
MVGGGGLIILVALLLGRTFPLGGRLHGLLFVGGVLNYALFYGGLNYGILDISAGETAILNYTAPLWIALFGHAMLGHALGPLRIAGLLLGFLGVALVVADKLRPGGEPAWGAYIAVLVGALSWGVGSVFFVRYLSGVPLEWAVGLQNVYGAVPLTLLWAAIDGARMPDPVLPFWVALAFSVLLGSFVAQLAFFSLLRRREAPVVGSYIFLVPVVAVLFGFLLLSEPLSAVALLGAGCVVVGIAMVNRPVRLAAAR